MGYRPRNAAFGSAWRIGVIVIAGVFAMRGLAEPVVEDKSFSATIDGTTQHYVVVLPEAFDRVQRHDLLIALHGHGSDRWQFVRDNRDECRAARDVAAQRNLLYVSPDYRPKTSWMGPKAEADLVQIIAEMKREYLIGNVFVCGGSMGGTAALTFAVRHPELIAGVASMNGTANLLEFEGFADAISESFGAKKSDDPREYRERSAEFFPERLTMPVGITAGGKDETVPADSVLRLGEALKTLHREVLVIYREDGGHTTTYDDGRAIIAFVLDLAKPAATDSATH